MKRENIEKVKNAIVQAEKIEYVLDRINNNHDRTDRKWDWEPANLNRDYVRQLKLTADEEKSMNVLKDAMTIILKNAAERTLADINDEIERM